MTVVRTCRTCSVDSTASSWNLTYFILSSARLEAAHRFGVDFCWVAQPPFYGTAADAGGRTWQSSSQSLGCGVGSWNAGGPVVWRLNWLSGSAGRKERSAGAPLYQDSLIRTDMPVGASDGCGLL